MRITVLFPLFHLVFFPTNVRAGQQVWQFSPSKQTCKHTVTQGSSLGIPLGHTCSPRHFRKKTDTARCSKAYSLAQNEIKLRLLWEWETEDSVPISLQSFLPNFSNVKVFPPANTYPCFRFPYSWCLDVADSRWEPILLPCPSLVHWDSRQNWWNCTS